jgi:hypothetical protein
MADTFILPVEATLLYTFDFSADIVAPATLDSVVFTTSPTGPSESPDMGGLTLSGQSSDLAEYWSSILVSGAVHGRVYTVQAAGTTSTNEVIVKDITLRGMNA